MEREDKEYIAYADLYSRVSRDWYFFTFFAMLFGVNAIIQGTLWFLEGGFFTIHFALGLLFLNLQYSMLILCELRKRKLEKCLEEFDGN